MPDESKQYGSEILTSIQKQIENRLASPLVGTFIISWCAINYRFILTLLSENTVTKKIYLIETVAYSSTYELITKAIALPLIATLAYIFLLPFPERIVFRYTRLQQKKIAALQNEIEGSELLTREESIELKLKLRQAEQEYKKTERRLTEEIEERDRLISTANKQLSQLQKTIETKEQANNPATSETTDERNQESDFTAETPKTNTPLNRALRQDNSAIFKANKDQERGADKNPTRQAKMDILSSFSSNRPKDKQELFNTLKHDYSEIRIEVALKELIEANVLDVNYDDDGHEFYTLSDSGKVHMIELGLA